MIKLAGRSVASSPFTLSQDGRIVIVIPNFMATSHPREYPNACQLTFVYYKLFVISAIM